MSYLRDDDGLSGLGMSFTDFRKKLANNLAGKEITAMPGQPPRLGPPTADEIRVGNLKRKTLFGGIIWSPPDRTTFSDFAPGLIAAAIPLAIGAAFIPGVLPAVATAAKAGGKAVVGAGRLIGKGAGTVAAVIAGKQAQPAGQPGTGIPDGPPIPPELYPGPPIPPEFQPPVQTSAPSAPSIVNTIVRRALDTVLPSARPAQPAPTSLPVDAMVEVPATTNTPKGIPMGVIVAGLAAVLGITAVAFSKPKHRRA